MEEEKKNIDLDGVFDEFSQRASESAFDIKLLWTERRKKVISFLS